MEPSKATTSPVVGRCSLIMLKRIAIDSTLGLKDRREHAHDFLYEQYN